MLAVVALVVLCISHNTQLHKTLLIILLWALVVSTVSVIASGLVAMEATPNLVL